MSFVHLFSGLRVHEFHFCQTFVTFKLEDSSGFCLSWYCTSEQCRSTYCKISLSLPLCMLMKTPAQFRWKQYIEIVYKVLWHYAAVPLEPQVCVVVTVL